MTTSSKKPTDPILAQLREAVEHAAAFLYDVDEDLTDGNQTARQVLSHLVFWHREYVRITGAFASNREPRLRSGKFHELNACADQEFRAFAMSDLAERFVKLQRRLEKNAQLLPDPCPTFSLKQGTTSRTLHDWSPQIQAHISNHVLRLERAKKRLAPGARNRRSIRGLSQ